jgi:hypothetical protein
VGGGLVKLCAVIPFTDFYLQATAHIIEVGYDVVGLLMCMQTYFK